MSQPVPFTPPEDAVGTRRFTKFFKMTVVITNGTVMPCEGIRVNANTDGERAGEMLDTDNSFNLQRYIIAPGHALTFDLGAGTRSAGVPIDSELDGQRSPSGSPLHGHALRPQGAKCALSTVLAERHTPMAAPIPAPVASVSEGNGAHTCRAIQVGSLGRRAPRRTSSRGNCATRHTATWAAGYPTDR